MQNQCRWFRETRNQDFYYVYYNTFSRFLLFNFCTFSRLFSIKKGCPEADSSKIEGDNPQQNSDSKKVRILWDCLLSACQEPKSTAQSAHQYFPAQMPRPSRPPRSHCGVSASCSYLRTFPGRCRDPHPPS